MKRELTDFFAKELLPSYLEGQLDPRRVEALEGYFSKDQQVKKKFENMKSQVAFLESLSEISPSPELVKFMEAQPGLVQTLREKYGWAKWPSTLQWTAELVLVGVLLLTTVHFFPWLNLARSLKTIKPPVPSLKNVTESVEPLRSKPIYGPFWPKDFPSPEQYALQLEEKQKKNAAIAEIVTRTDEESSAQSADTEEDAEAAPKKEGFVWRGVLKVSELDEETANKVTNEIVALGGQKAGQVELGWKKGDTRYYHFTLPIANYTEFQEKMSDVGTMTLTKEKHPRVMKDDEMRIIMSVEAEK